MVRQAQQSQAGSATRAGRGARAANLLKYKECYLLLIPALVLFLVFRYVPMAGIVLAWKQFTVTGGVAFRDVDVQRLLHQPGRRRRHGQSVAAMGGTGYSTDGPVLVLGATGTVGSELVRQLSAGGALVRAFVRDEARARDLFGQLTVELALGDLSEPETVKRAARGCAQLFLLTEMVRNRWSRRPGLRKRPAGVAHIVSLSSSDSARDAPFGWAQAHYAIEQHVESLGVDYSHLRPHYFMQNLLGALQVEAGSVVLRLPLGSGRISAVDVRDIAACAAAVLVSTPLGRPAVLTGGESFTLDEAASVVAQHSGIPIRYDDEEPRAHLEWMLAHGVERREAESISLGSEWGRAGKLDRVTAEVETITGRSPRRLGEFAAKVAAPVLQRRYQAGRQHWPHTPLAFTRYGYVAGIELEVGSARRVRQQRSGHAVTSARRRRTPSPSRGTPRSGR